MENNIKEMKYIDADNMRSLIDWCIAEVSQMEDVIQIGFKLYHAEPSKYKN
jgi:hypothetical protein